MKFAFSTLACPQWSIETVIEKAVQFGYDGIELRLLDGEVIDPERDRERVLNAVALCALQNLAVCALDTSCTLNQAELHLRTQQITTLQTWIALAMEVHVPILRVFGGQGQPGYSPAQEDTWVAEVLREVAPQAEQSGVTIALETHDAYASARRVANVLQTVPSSAVAALWDSHHPYRVGETAEQVIQALDGRIAHVHVKDAVRVSPTGSDWQLVLLGEGEVPVRSQLRVLQQHHYSGYISVEWEKKWHSELAEPDIALPEHIAWLKSTYPIDR
jgi:sugar phosphate isomerase/epimerase